MIREFFHDLTAGVLGKVNLAMAALPPAVYSMDLETGAKTFAAFATGVWFVVQTVCLIADRVRKARDRKP